MPNFSNPETQVSSAPMPEPDAHTNQLTAELLAIAAETKRAALATENHIGSTQPSYGVELNDASDTTVTQPEHQVNQNQQAIDGQNASIDRLPGVANVNPEGESTRVYENPDDDPVIKSFREEVERITREDIAQAQAAESSPFDRKEMDSGFSGNINVRDKISRRVIIQQANAFISRYPEKAAAYREQLGFVREALERKEKQLKNQVRRENTENVDGQAKQSQQEQQGSQEANVQDQGDLTDEERLSNDHTSEEFENILANNPDLVEMGWNAEAMAEYELLGKEYEELAERLNEIAKGAERGIAKVQAAMVKGEFDVNLLFHPETTDPVTGRRGLALDNSEGRYLAIFSKAFAISKDGVSADVNTLNNTFLQNMKLTAEQYKQDASRAKEFADSWRSKIRSGGRF